MELFTQIISHHFTWGLLIGLILLVLSWKSGRKDKKYLKNELKRVSDENSELQTHLGTQLKINAKGNETLQGQLDELKEQNSTLKVNIQTLQQKPEKIEHRRLEVMESAVTTMREQAPGFAQAWEKSMRQAEDEMEAVEGGLKKLIRKVVPNFRSTPSGSQENKNAKLIEVSTEAEETSN